MIGPHSKAPVRRCVRRLRCRSLTVERLESRTLLATAGLLSLASGTAHASGFLARPDEVDLYQVHLGAGDRVSAAVTAQTSGSGLTSLLRMFDDHGKQVALDDQEGGDPSLAFQAAQEGDYFVGVSSVTTGRYALDLHLTPLAPLQADLAGSSFRLGANTAAWGEVVQATFAIDNRGGADSGAFMVQLFLAPDPLVDPSNALPLLPAPIAVAGLAAGAQYRLPGLEVTLPNAATAQAAGFALSGPVYLGLRITPADPSQDFGASDKGGVHRGEDSEGLTIVTPVPAGTTDLSQADANLNTRATGTLATNGQTDTYTFTVSTALGSGRLTLQSNTTAGTLVPRLTLSGPGGKVLIQADDGPIVQYLQPGTYSVSISALSGVGSYQLVSQFVPGNAPSTPVGVGAKPNSVAVVDVNGDGRPDLVVANRGNDTVSVLPGNGDGTFQTGQTISLPAGSAPNFVAVADVNGDGKPDLVVVDYGSPGATPPVDSSVSVFLGKGDGTFTLNQTIPVGPLAYAAAVADLDGDGKPDLVVASKGKDAGGQYDVSVFRGDGTGSFALAQVCPVGPSPVSVAVADVNGDGRPDLVVADNAPNQPTAGAVSVLLQNNNGTFGPARSFSTGRYPTAVAVADFTGDGMPDIAVTNFGDGDVSVLPQQADGTFGPQQTYPVGAYPNGMALADVNGDGRPDLVVANLKSSTVSVLVADGHGSFLPHQDFSAGSSPDAVAVADVDGDGKPDVVTTNRYSYAATVLEGRGDGTFEVALPFPTGALPVRLAVGDFNGDGKPDDVAVANLTGASGTVGVLLGNGDGTLAAQQSLPIGANPFSVAVADLNGDGRPDLVATNYYFDGAVHVLLGNGDGTFGAPAVYPVGFQPSAVAVADVNADKIPDLVVAGSAPGASGEVAVLLGKGDGTFQDSPSYLAQHTFAAGKLPRSVTVASVDGDGKPDVVVANYGGSSDLSDPNHYSDSVSVLRGNGDGTFGPPLFSPGGGEPNSVTVLPVAGAGPPDVVVADTNDGTVNVLKPNGDGTFTTAQSIPIGVRPYSVAAADVNGDGRPDLVVADNNGAGTVVVLLQQADGTFPNDPGYLASHTFSVGAYPASVAVADFNGAVADFNGDGRPDLVASNFGSNNVTVLLGNGDGTFTPSTPSSGVGPRDTPYLVDAGGDSVVLDRSGHILFRKGLPGSDAQFGSPVPLNDSAHLDAAGNVFLDGRPASDTQGQDRPARDLTVLQTATGPAIATVDARFDPTLSSPGHFMYTVSLYTLPTSGEGTRTTVLSTSMLPTRIAAADLNGDGLDDLVVAYSLDNQVQVAFQQPDGTFSAPLTLSTAQAPSDIVLKDAAGKGLDVNGDGLPDIVVSNQATGDVTVLLNDKSHSFTTSERFRAGTGLYGLDPATSTVATLEQSASLAAGDFTSGGHNDLVVVNRGAHSFSVLPGDGSGGFGDPSADLTTSTSDGLAVNNQPGPVVAGDFNSDGNLDLAILMEDSAQVWVYTGDGHGHFTHTFSVAAGSLPTGLSAVRNAQTGLLDLLVGDQFGDILRLRGQGDGTFQPPPLTGDHVSLDVQTIAGRPQVLLANQRQNHVIVESPVAGNQQFAPTQSVAIDATTPFAPSDAQWIALNQNDPTLDAVVLRGAGNSVQVYRPAPAGQGFVLQTTQAVGTDPVSVTVADLNGDGILDMLVTNRGSNDVSVLFGAYDAEGHWFATPGPRLKSGGDGPIATTLRDTNGDGVPDLIVTNGTSGTLAVLPGLGLGFFDDRNLHPIPLGSPVTAPPVFVQGMGVLPTEDGAVVAFNPTTLAPLGEVFGPAGVTALGAAPDGRLVVAEPGAVDVLALDPAGQFEVGARLEPLTGIPSEPSALAVLESESGLEALVTSAGLDTVFVFDFASTGTIPFPVLPPSTPGEPGASTLPSAPLLVVVTLLSGGLPQDATLDHSLQGGNGEAGIGPGATAASGGVATGIALSGDPGGARPALAALAGDEPEAKEEDRTLPASAGPNPLDALRNLRLYRPGEDSDGAAAPRGDAQSAVPTTAADPPDQVPVVLARRTVGTDLVWEDLSWLEGPTREASPSWAETALAGAPAVVAGDVAPTPQVVLIEPALRHVEPRPSPQEPPAAIEHPDEPGWTIRAPRFALALVVGLGLAWAPWRLPGPCPPGVVAPPGSSPPRGRRHPRGH
jgi:hypothetical protein